MSGLSTIKVPEVLVQRLADRGDVLSGTRKENYVAISRTDIFLRQQALQLPVGNRTSPTSETLLHSCIGIIIIVVP